MPKHTALDVYTCGTRVRSLVALDDGELLPIGTEGTIIEARITASGIEYLIDFDGSAFESSSLSATEIEEVPAELPEEPKCAVCGKDLAAHAEGNPDHEFIVPPRALIGPTGYGSFGILWRNAPALATRGGYSGSFDTLQAAEERAVDIALFHEGAVPSISYVENVNRVCSQCDALMPDGCTVTCGNSECQEKEAADNMARARKPARKARKVR